jgi:hypothetical protein
MISLRHGLPSIELSQLYLFFAFAAISLTVSSCLYLFYAQWVGVVIESPTRSMNGWKGVQNGKMMSEKLPCELVLRLENCLCALPVLPPREGVWTPKSCLTYLHFGAILGTEIHVECFSVARTETVVNHNLSSENRPARNDGLSALILSVFRGSLKG